jgi:glyoxylase-like metal-dependent hydrolase (beta-lactamase superfamily II)
MQITEHVYNMHIDDGHISHPGGSNNFFVGNINKEMVLIDTGDYEKKWTDEILGYHQEIGKPNIKAILITHGHYDHIGGLSRIYESFEAPVRCHPLLADKLSKVIGNVEMVIPLQDEEIINVGDVQLKALFTPGHESDHICFYLKNDLVMFTGDSVLGSSSTSVKNLSEYMKSLDFVLNFKHEIVCPAHGPVAMPPKGSDLIAFQKAHRIKRENQVLGSLKKGLTEISDIVDDIYARHLTDELRPIASRNVKTHLIKLLDEGVVEMINERFNVKK